MKFDMHCHTKEGSIDGKVPIEEYITELERLGYQGMLITDHNSYNGYRWWKKNIKDKTFLTFYDKIIGYQNYKEGNKLQFIE